MGFFCGGPRGAKSLRWTGGWGALGRQGVGGLGRLGDSLSFLRFGAVGILVTVPVSFGVEGGGDGFGGAAAFGAYARKALVAVDATLRAEAATC